MTLHYVASSGWAKLLVEEDESESLSIWVEQRLAAAETFASSHLLVTELHHIAGRMGVSPPRGRPRCRHPDLFTVTLVMDGWRALDVGVGGHHPLTRV